VSGTMKNTVNDVMIGNNPPNNRPFDGLIDEVRIYNRALTSSEISTIYASGATAPTYSEFSSLPLVIVLIINNLLGTFTLTKIIKKLKLLKIEHYLMLHKSWVIIAFLAVMLVMNTLLFTQLMRIFLTLI
jgi:hypothetical protein